MIVAIDTETALIRPGLLAPRLICLSWAVADGAASDQGLAAREEALRIAHGFLDSSDTIVGANLPYDFGVLCAEDPAFIPKIFRAYEEGRARCVQTRQQLIDIAKGELKFSISVSDTGEETTTKTKHDLATLTAKWCGRKLEKTDTWRLRYEELEEIPLIDWPIEAINYALEDARATLDVYLAQQAVTESGIPTEADQQRAHWVLHLMSLWGLRTDKAAVEKIYNDLKADYEASRARIMAAGLLHDTGSKKKPKWTKNTKEIQRRIMEGFAAQGLTPPMTPTGQPKTDEDTKRLSKDPSLIALADDQEKTKLFTDFIPVLQSGVEVPINPRWGVLVSTARTSCAKPNIQQLPTFGDVRPCFVPRERYRYIGADYHAAELRSFAQVCWDLFGESAYAETFRRGEDPHLKFAASMMGISFEEILARGKKDPEVKKRRDFAKVWNFGKIGGMGANTFVGHAAKHGFHITVEQAKEYDRLWRSEFPEVVLYLGQITRMFGRVEGDSIHHRTGFVRGGVGYSDGANHQFQHLTAMGAKHAAWNVSRECYLEKGSDLYGSRLVAFLHDELICEAPEEKGAKAAMRLAKVMEESMAEYLPDIPVKAEPWMTRRWYKGAEGVYDGEGNLMCWERG